MKIKEYRRMSVEKLKEELKKLRKEKIKCYGNMAMAKVKKNKEGESRGGTDLSKRIRKEIAKIKTILNETKIK